MESNKKNVVVNFPYDSIEDYEQKLGIIIERAVRSIIEESNSKVNENLTRKQTTKYLNLSLTTLYNYTKQGILKSHRVGNRVIYKKSELDKALRPDDYLPKILSKRK